MAHHHEITVPKPLLVAVGAMLLMAVVLSGLSARGIIGSKSMVPPATASLWSDVHFVDKADGAMEVVAASDGRRVMSYARGEGTFVRGMLRGMAFERRKLGVGPGPAFRLTRWSDGRMSIHDLATGLNNTLNGFGKDNRESFETLLRAGLDADGNLSRLAVALPTTAPAPQAAQNLSLATGDQ